MLDADVGPGPTEVSPAPDPGGPEPVVPVRGLQQRKSSGILAVPHSDSPTTCEETVLERIMIPMDGSRFSEFALPVGLEIARRSESAVELVNVNDPLPALPEELPPELSMEEASGRYLEELRERIAGEWSVETHPRVMRGPVVEALERAARDAGVDMVVMATHGRGPFSRFWLGSVADGFVRRATVPVLLVRPDDDEDPELAAGADFGTVVLPLDRSEVSMDVVEDALEVGDLFGARYHLVTVVSHPSEYVDTYFPESVGFDSGWIEGAKEEARRRLEVEAERMEKRGHEVGISVVEARTPARGILEVAEEVDGDLIAMGTHGRGGVPRMVLGSVADKVVRASDCPVLLYRPPTE